MQVRLIAQYDVPPADQDESSETGLTQDAFEALHDQLAGLGFDDITFQKPDKDS